MNNDDDDDDDDNPQKRLNTSQPRVCAPFNSSPVSYRIYITNAKCLFEQMMVHLVFLYIYYSLPFMLPIVIIASRTGEFYLCLSQKCCSEYF